MSQNKSTCQKSSHNLSPKAIAVATYAPIKSATQSSRKRQVDPRVGTGRIINAEIAEHWTSATKAREWRVDFAIMLKLFSNKQPSQQSQQ
jgi:hypothetical protein